LSVNFYSMHRFIISGGPGSGKTTLLRALQEMNYHCSEEVSRQLIREEVANGSNCLPWINLPCFAQKALDRMIINYKTAERNKITFFDRGIPDIVAYLKAGGQEITASYMHAMKEYSYSSLVFLTPPWEAIYVKDSERWQSFDESVTLYHLIKETYLSQGYNILELPKLPVDQRIHFLLESISQQCREKV
jgi:predicted ATPase